MMFVVVGVRRQFPIYLIEQEGKKNTKKSKAKTIVRRSD